MALANERTPCVQQESSQVWLFSLAPTSRRHIIKYELCSMVNKSAGNRRKGACLLLHLPPQPSTSKALLLSRGHVTPN